MLHSGSQVHQSLPDVVHSGASNGSNLSLSVIRGHGILGDSDKRCIALSCATPRHRSRSGQAGWPGKDLGTTSTAHTAWLAFVSPSFLLAVNVLSSHEMLLTRLATRQWQAYMSPTINMMSTLANHVYKFEPRSSLMGNNIKLLNQQTTRPHPTDQSQQ